MPNQPSKKPPTTLAGHLAKARWKNLAHGKRYLRVGRRVLVYAPQSDGSPVVGGWYVTYPPGMIVRLDDASLARVGLAADMRLRRAPPGVLAAKTERARLAQLRRWFARELAAIEGAP